MNRTETACFALLASAFVLAGLLLVNLQTGFTQTAQAEMVLNKGSSTVMTAQTRPGEEGLFVLDGVNQRLLIYRVDITRKRFELADNVDLRRMFAAGGGSTTPDRGGRIGR